MNGFLEGMVINITSSLLYDIFKKSFLKDDGIDHFKRASTETIDYFHNLGIELINEYFENFINEPEVIQAVESFHEGIDYVPKEILINSFLKTDFYWLNETERRQKATDIINFFIKRLTNNILKDPKTNATYLNSVAQINFKKNNEFVQGIRANTILILNEIDQLKDKFDVFSDKQDMHIEISTETMVLVRDLHKMYSNSIKEKEEQKVTDSDFQKSLKIANDLFEKGLYDTAREMYTGMFDTEHLNNEEKWKLNRNIALTYLITNKPIEAVPYFKEAYSALPNEYRGKLQNIFALMLEDGEQAALDKFNSVFSDKELDYDERLMKMELLMKLGKLSDAKDLFDEKTLENPDNRYSYSRILFEMKEYDKAIEEIEKVIEVKANPYMMYDYGIYKLSYILKDIHEGVYLSNRQPTKIINDLRETLRILNDAVSKLEKTQNKRFYASAIFNRGVVNAYLGNEDEARQDFENAEKLGLNDFINYFNIAISYVRIGNFNKAIEYFRKASDIDKAKALPHLLDSLLYNKDFTEIKKLCLENISYPEIQLDKDNIKIYLSLAIALNRELDKTGANIILSGINDIFPNDYDFILTKTKILWERGEKDGAIKFIESKKDNADKYKDVVHIKLADYYFSNSQWQDAEYIYKDYLDVDEVISLNYLMCLHNLNKDEELIEYAKKLLYNNTVENKDKVNEALGYSYLELENYVDALPIFQELSIRTKNSMFYYNWAFCEIKLLNKVNALKVAAEAEKEFKDKFKELAKISSIYFNAGDKKRALDIAFLSAQNLPEDSDVNANFVTIINSLINEPELVTEEQKVLYNHLMQNWDILFPELKLFEKIPFEHDFKTIRDNLEERSKYGLMLTSMYERKQIPLSFYSNQCGANIYDVWKDMSMSNMSKISAFNPSTFGKQYEVLKLSGKIVIGPFAFFTLYELGLHQFLNNYCFPQGLLDELVQQKSELDMASVQGRNSIMSIDGRLIRFEVPPEEIKKEIIKIEDMINFVKQYIQGSNKSFVDKRISGVLKKADIQAINISMESNIPIFCDDALLNDLMQDKLPNYKYFSTLIFIQYLLDNKIIDKYRFNELILKLIWMNYYFVPVNANILLHNIESQEFSEYNINKKAINSLRDLSQARELNIKVVCDFILSIYHNKAISEFNRNNWVDYILNSFTINDTKKEVTLNLIYKKINDFLDTLFNNHKISTEEKDEFLNWFKKIIKYR